MHKVFKPIKKTDRATCAYLYDDNHLVVIFERRERGVNTEYCKIAQNIGLTMASQGRLVFHDVSLLIAIASLPQVSVQMSNGSVDAGSDKTKALGLEVGNLIVRSGLGWFHIATLPTLLSSGLTYQRLAQIQRGGCTVSLWQYASG
jgi:hypothetical protein